MNQLTYINRKTVRALALECSRQSRNGRFTRVGKDFLLEVNCKIAEIVAAMVHRAPSIGHTLKGEYANKSK